MEQDQRFSHIITDPKFRRIPKAERKVKIDKRFKSMFNDKQFKIKYTTDKRGRPLNHTSTEDLKRFYELSSEESSESGQEDADDAPQQVGIPKSSLNDSKPSDANQLNVKFKNDEQLSNKVKNKLHNLNIDYARGESTLFSESSSDDDESDEDVEEAVEHAWGELDRDAEHTDEITHRLAACNMDWDRIKAVDLMVLLSSFLPPGGLIQSVTIYPSEFGLQRIKEEEIKGPTELVESKFEADEEDENNEGSKYHMEKLRQYQLNRLKYYYAVIVCDNKNTANKIYTECDGMEYESSATKIDLRFIPDNMTFTEEPKEFCEKLPEPGKYQPRFFTTTALQQAKVNLTWDETNPDRIEITQKLAAGNTDEVADGDLQAYLASSSGEESDEEKQSEISEASDVDNKNSKLSSIDKYKALLHGIENQEKTKLQKDVEMEVTWGINLKEKTEKLIKKKLDEKEEKTPFQQYLDKRKEKQKTKREIHKKNQISQDDKSSESDSDIPSDIDMSDPYFAEEFNKPEFKQRKTSKIRNVITSSEDQKKEAELELLLLNSDNKKHFNLQKIQENENESKTKKKLKNKNRKEETPGSDGDDFQINVADARFSALYSSHHFNIDPTDPRYKKTRAMEAIVTEKLKRRIETSVSVQNKKVKGDSVKKDAELSVLVKSVKRNAATFRNKRKNK